MWAAIGGLVAEIRKCEKVGAHMGALVLCFVCADAMAYLAMPAGQPSQTRADFISWINTYLTGHPEQLYQYRGIDVYAARCAVLHQFGTEAMLHNNDPDIKMFGYHDGGRHAFDQNVDPRLVIIGMASFFNDVIAAVGAFMEACRADPALRTRVEQRLPSVLANLPLARGA